MAGEIDFEQALRQRVRLLAGLDESDLDAVRRSLSSPGRAHAGAHPASGSATRRPW
jgi:phosphoserine phosphatase